MKIISLALAIEDFLICISTSFRSIQTGDLGNSKGCSLRSRFLHEKNSQLQYQETDFSERNRYHSGHFKDMQLGKRFRKFVEQLSHSINRKHFFSLLGLGKHKSNLPIFSNDCVSKKRS